MVSYGRKNVKEEASAKKRAVQLSNNDGTYIRERLRTLLKTSHVMIITIVAI